jgi:hypothetical protein
MRSDYLAAPNAHDHNNDNWEGQVTLQDDTYALGGVMAQLFAGELVEVDPQAEDEPSLVLKGQIQGLIQGDRIPVQIRGVIERMMHPNPAQRPPLGDVWTQLDVLPT